MEQSGKRKNTRFHCLQLIRRFAKEGELLCRICSKSNNARRVYRTSTDAIDHAIRHLGEPLYHCRHCSVWKTCRQNMYHHVRTAHRMPANDAVIDYSDKYADDILRMLEKCFDRSRDGGDFDKIDGISKTKKKTDFAVKKSGHMRSHLKNRKQGFRSRSQGNNFGYFELPHKIEAIGKSKLVYKPCILYKCQNCLMTSRYKSLVRNHMRKIH